MVASAHDNLSFETEAADADPMEPTSWTVAITSSGEEIANWDTAAEAVEDFEEGWHAQILSLATGMSPYTSPHAIVSLAGPFALVDGMVLQLTQNGLSLESVQFLEADFVDITMATAAEVAAVMTAALVGFQVDTIVDRVRVRSNPFGRAPAVVGHGSANQALGFPIVYEEFAGPELDLETVPWVDDFTVESFTNKWAGIPAILVTANKEPFVVSNGDDLDVTVNGIPQTVTFAGIAVGGAATAEEIAANITAQLITAGGEAEADAVADTDVIMRTEFAGFGATIEVTGGTAEAALGFYPSAGFGVGSGFFAVLPGNTAALWDSTPENYEDFEEGWSNDAFAWILTDEVIRITQELAGVTYTITLTSGDIVEEYEYTAVDGDTLVSIADELDTDIDAGSVLVSSLELGFGVLRLVRLDTRTDVRISVATSTGVDAIEHGTELTSAAIAVASYDTINEGFEDFEEEWSNDDGTWLWRFSFEYLDVLTAVSGREYAVTLGSGTDFEEEFSYTANGADTVNTIAAALSALIDASTNYDSSNIANVVQIESPDTRVPTEPVVSDPDDLFLHVNNTGPGIILAMTFGATVPGPREAFESGGAPQFEISFGGADPVPAGTYSFSILGVPFEYTSGGADTRADMSNEFIGQINNSTIRHLVNAALSSDDIWLTSISCPKTLLDVSDPSSPSDTLEATPSDPNTYWDDFHTMCTI